ncbi:AP-1 complex-associated regulatory protein-like isoform X1 [Carassius carassius]|uniref:AP-1 complex-associated regulatory protein-like isoform X1 n=1 Tax=Carassius carassius TaxID=217509 RepID=UPI0028691D1B|nr:AP-1 complex-associated regulatory protein-like isoform X1 [Carassius carassius]
MGNCWAQCFGLFRREANRIQRGGGSKYFRSSTAGEHYTIEFENLVESDEGESSQSCPRPVSEEEINHLKEHRYAAISDKQALIDEKLKAELVAEEEKLRLEEEAVFAAQREAARLAKEQKLKEGKQPLQRTKPRSEPESKDPRHKPKASDAEFEVYLQSVKTQSEAFRSNRLSSETNVVTPNTESSWDFTSKTDATSLDLEWEDEEGMNRMGPAWERSKTEEDILRAALRPGGKQLDSGPTSTSEDSNALEWENDFVSAHPEDSGDHRDEDFEGFVNPVVDTPTEEAEQKASSDQQEER